MVETTTADFCEGCDSGSGRSVPQAGVREVWSGFVQPRRVWGARVADRKDSGPIRAQPPRESPRRLVGHLADDHDRVRQFRESLVPLLLGTSWIADPIGRDGQ